MSTPLAGKTAVVTGGASGIGRACAHSLSAAGANVVIADLAEDRGLRAATDIAGATGGEVAFVPADVSEEDASDRLVNAAVERFGAVDVLVAAAGITHASYAVGERSAADPTAAAQPGVIDKPVADWDRVLAVNLRGTMLTNRAVARHLVDRGGGGCIVNISSGSARIPSRGTAEYCVSKAGISMLTRVLALELAPHSVRVNAVAPGLIDTPMTAGIIADERRRERAIKKIPAGRSGTPEDVASAVLFLVCDQSSFITGTILDVNGGQISL